MFRTSLIPDELSVYEALPAIERGEQITISWPDVSNVMYERLVARRPELSGQLMERGVERGPRLVSAVREFDQGLEAARVRREHAASRIPLMWAGMADYWGPQRPDAFRTALHTFLVVANLEALVDMGAVHFDEDPPLPDGLRPSHARHQHFQNPAVAEALDGTPPFWSAAITIAGQSLYIFAPEGLLDDVKDELHKRKPNVSFLVSKFIVPQVELHVITEPMTLTYHPTDLQVQKVRDENFAEV
jgi:hypothetical protein